MHRAFPAILVLCITTCLYAQTRISGDISKTAFDRSGNPFIVEKDITVPPGAKVAITEGCVFLFNPFTGLSVQGRLTVAGTTAAPVVFTSVNDNDVNPTARQLANPFDWNGILISRESSGATLTNFALRYSVYGIKAQTQDIAIQNGVFRQNGQFHFTVNDKIEYVQDNIPYSYGDILKPSTNAKSSVTAASSGKKAVPKKPADKTGIHNGKGRKAVRFAGLGAGIAGIGVGTALVIPAITSYYDWVNVSDAWKKRIAGIADADTFSNADSAIQVIFREYSPKYNKAEKKFKGYTAASIILESLGALGFLTFGLSFAF
jgi:hypothetical protein